MIFFLLIVYAALGAIIIREYDITSGVSGIIIGIISVIFAIFTEFIINSFK